MNLYLGRTRVCPREKSREDLEQIMLESVVISPLLLKFKFSSLHLTSFQGLKNEFIERQNCILVPL